MWPLFAALPLHFLNAKTGEDEKESPMTCFPWGVSCRGYSTDNMLNSSTTDCDSSLC